MNLRLAIIYLKLPHWSHVLFLIFMCLLVESHLYSFSFKRYLRLIKDCPSFTSAEDMRLYITFESDENDITRYQDKYFLFLSNSKIIIIIICDTKTSRQILVYFAIIFWFMSSSILIVSTLNRTISLLGLVFTTLLVL